MSNPLQPELQAQLGHKRRTRRAKRGKGKKPHEHHADAKAHMANAQSAPTPGAAMPHLFKALRSMHAAKPTDEQGQ